MDIKDTEQMWAEFNWLQYKVQGWAIVNAITNSGAIKCDSFLGPALNCHLNTDSALLMQLRDISQEKKEPILGRNLHTEHNLFSSVSVLMKCG
jgi:hypothetical protein